MEKCDVDSPKKCDKPGHVRVRAYCRKIREKLTQRRPGKGKSFSLGQLKERLSTIEAERKALDKQERIQVVLLNKSLDAGNFTRYEELEGQIEEIQARKRIMERDHAFTVELIEAFGKMPLSRSLGLQEIDAAIQRKIKAASLEAIEEGRDRYALYLDQRHLGEQLLDHVKRAGVDLRTVDAFSRWDSHAHRRKLAPYGAGHRSRSAAAAFREVDLEDAIGELVQEMGLDARLGGESSQIEDDDPAHILAAFLAPALENKRTLEEFSMGIDPARRAEIEALEAEAKRLLERVEASQ